MGQSVEQSIETRVLSNIEQSSSARSFSRHAELFSQLDDPMKPILGDLGSNVLAPNLEVFLRDPNNVIAELKLHNKLIGFSVSIPISRFEPSRFVENDRSTAYIYATVIDETYQHQGLVGTLTDLLMLELQKKGYKIVERDCKIGNGYAGVVEKHYNQSGSIISSQEHCKWPDIGPEKNFRIDINTYVSWLGKQQKI
jgi:predicted GNAT family acetyltransferase